MMDMQVRSLDDLSVVIPTHSYLLFSRNGINGFILCLIIVTVVYTTFCLGTSRWMLPSIIHSFTSPSNRHIILDRKE